ncbi:MAG: hypothetical protein ACRELB_14805 [Polyangiaceae bacterium]
MSLSSLCATGFVLSLALAGPLCACTSAAKGETAALASAVDRYRRAEASGKEAAGRALGGVACTDPRVCEARRACVAAVEPTVRALALKDEVTRRLADVEQKRLAPDSPEAMALPDKLDEAQRLLEEGRSHQADCDARLAALQLAVGS